jgi:signal transduction histidine kinase
VIRHRHSVRARLTAWYAVTLLTTFVLAVAGLRTALAETLKSNFRASLSHSGDLVTGFFRFELAEYHDVDKTVAHLAEQLVFAERRVRFLPPSGHELPEVADVVGPREALPPPLYSIVLPLDPELAPGWRVRIIGSTAADVALLRRMDLWFGGLILVSVVVASAGGWWLAGRALRPVREMAAAAERITAERSSERLPVGPEPDEFARLGRRFNALLDRLDGALAQQRRFLADAAHELRTPVARLRGAVELALDPRADAADQHATLVRMRDDLADSSRLLDELLQLARADAGGQEVLLAPAYLDDVVVEALGAWRAVAAGRGVALELPVVEETPALLDAALVRRLLGVLVDKALRYTPAGGRVAVAVRREADVAVLEVADTGVGMTAEERARAFERFFRGARARKLTPDGSGLGLAIAAWVAQRHGASIALDDATPTGTPVTVRFPLAPAGAGPGGPPAGDGAPDADGASARSATA